MSETEDSEGWQCDVIISNGRGEIANFRRLGEPRGMPATGAELGLLMGAPEPDVFWNSQDDSGALDVAACYELQQGIGATSADPTTATRALDPPTD